MRNVISIYLNKESIMIKIQEDAEYIEIIEELKIKLPELKKFYKNEKTPILVAGKILKNREMDEIKYIIQQTINVPVDFEIPKTLGLHSIKKSFNKNIEISETKFLRNSLRSGQRIEVEGSIVLIGDVNSGAEIIASDNIIIMGSLRGLAHAGAKGNRKAIIAAGAIDTVQIRIADIVKEMNKSEEKNELSYCYVEKENIKIE